MRLALFIVVLTASKVFSDSVTNFRASLHTKDVENQKCAQHCKASSKFKLRTGSDYVYNYQAETVTTVTGTSNDTSRILLSALAHLRVLSPCDISLELQNVLLKESAPLGGLEETKEQVEFQSALEKNALTFTYQDGIINELCPSQDEPVWVLNIKRGLLSALQNSMIVESSYTHLYEVDVSGTCETIYKSIAEEGDYVYVKKQKNILSCLGHRKQPVGLTGVFTTNEARSLPLIKSDQQCEQYISHSGHLHSTQCNESHIFLPISNKHSGISTRVFQNLTLQNIIEIPSAKSGAITTWRTDLQYEYASGAVHDTVRFADITHILDKVITILKDGVTTEVTELSSLLVKKLGAVDQNTLVELFIKYKETVVHSLLLNALIRVGTSHSMTAIQDLYKNHHITEDELSSWLSSLALHRNPTLEILNSLDPILDNHYHTESVLALSTLLYSYCLLDSECDKQKEVQSIMKKIEDKLVNACTTSTHEDRHNVIVALKAIGNAGVLIHPLETLSACYKNDLNPMDVRLSAISAMRRFKCDKIDKASISDMFVDNQQDTELRIAAYLIATQCPGILLIDDIKNVLYTENVTQVTSFVWTHLKTSQRKLNNIEIQEILDSDLSIKYKSENMKLSQSREFSVFSDILNTGAIIDSNIVFSPHSYLPRSATLNLTLDMFGQVFNFFEIGARLEGFEYFLDSLLGEKKGMGSRDIFPLRNFLQGLQEDRNKNVIKKHSDESNSEEKLNRNLNGLLYTRIFGNEMYLTQFPSKKTDNADIRNPQTQNTRKNGIIDYANSFVFLDLNYEIPTVVGLPLKVLLNGNAVVGLKLDRKANFNFTEKDSLFELSLFMNPSAVVQVETFMGVDAKLTQAGVKSKSTVQSNTYLDATMQLKNKELVRVSVNVPRNQMDIINITSKMYAIHKNISTEIKGVGDNMYSWDSCRGKRVPTLTGMRLCSQFSLGNVDNLSDAPYFPLTSPFTYAFNLQKSDTFDVYNFQLKNVLREDNGRNVREVAVEFDTPGSTMDRKIEAKCIIDAVNNSVAIILRSPNRKLDMNGKLDNTKFDKGLSITFSNNGKETISLKVLLRMIDDPAYNRYESSIRVYIQQFIDVDIDGYVSWIENTKYSTALRISGLSRNPLKLSGDVTKDNGHYALGLEVKSPVVDAKIKGSVKKKSSQFTTKGLIQYSVNKSQLRSVDFGLNLQKSYIRSLTKYSLIFKVQPSEATEYRTKLMWNLVTGESYLRCNTQLKFGDNVWNSHQLYQYVDNSDVRSFNFELSLSSPTNNIDYRSSLSYFVTDSSFQSYAFGQLSKEKRYLARFDYNYLSASNRSLVIDIENPQYSVNLKSQVSSMKENEFSGNLTVKFGNNIRPTEISGWITFNMNDTSVNGGQKVYGEIFYPLLSQSSIKFNLGEKRISDRQYNWIIVNLKDKTYQLEYNTTNEIRQTYFERSLYYSDGTHEGSVYFSRRNANATLEVKVKLEKTFFFIFERMDDILESFLKVHFFWDYVHNSNKSIKLEFQRQLSYLRAFIVTPGHCARLSVSQFYEGSSSMNVTAQWGENEKSLHKTMTLTTLWIIDLPKAVINVVLITPFSGFEHQAFNLDVLIPMNSFYSSFLTQLEWQNHTAKIQGVAEYYQGVIKGHLQINSPLSFLQQMVIHVYNQYETSDKGISMNINGQVTISEEKDFTLKSLLISNEDKQAFEFEILKAKENYKILSGKYFSNKGNFNAETSFGQDKNITLFCTYNFPTLFSLLLETTFEEYNIIAVEYFGQANKTDILALLQATWNNHVTSLNLSGTLSEVSVAGKIDLLSLAPNVLKSASLSINHTNTGISISDHVYVKLGNNSNKRDLLDFYFYLDNSKKVSLLLITPMHNMSGDFLYTVLYSQQLQMWKTIELNFSGSWNQNKCNISATVKHDSSEISGEIKVMSTALKDNLCASFSHYKDDRNQYTTLLKFPYDIVIQHKFFLRNYFTWSNSFQITSLTKSIYILNKQEIVNNTTFNHTTMFTINGQTYSLEIFSNKSRQSDEMANLPYMIESIMYLTVPWRDPIKVGGALSVHEISTTKKIKMEAYIVLKKDEVVHLLTGLQYNRFEGSFDLIMTFPLNKQFSLTGSYDLVNTEKTFFLFCYCGGKDFSIQGALNSLNLNSVLQIKSTEVGNILNINFTQYSNDEKKNVKFLMEFLNVKYCELTLTKIHPSQMYEAEFGMIIPAENWVNVTGKVMLDWFNKEFRLNFNRNKDTFNIQGLMTLSFAHVSGNLFVDYVFNHISNRYSVEYMFEHGVTIESLEEQKIIFASVVCKSKQGNYSAQCKIIKDKDQSYTADILLHLPFSGFNNISVTADINVKNNLEFKIKGQKENWIAQINGNVLTNKSKEKLNKIANIFLLYPNENITATVEYEKISDLDRYIISVNTNIAGLQIVSQVQNKNFFLVEYKMKTPFRNFETISGSGLLSVNEGLRFESVLSTGNKNFSLVYNHINGEKGSAESSINILTPFKGFGNITGYLGHSFLNSSQYITTYISVKNQSNLQQKVANDELHFYVFVTAFVHDSSEGPYLFVNVTLPRKSSHFNMYGSYRIHNIQKKYLLVLQETSASQPILNIDLYVNNSAIDLITFTPATGHCKFSVIYKNEYNQEMLSFSGNFNDVIWINSTAFLQFHDESTVKAGFDIFSNIHDWEQLKSFIIYNISVRKMLSFSFKKNGVSMFEAFLEADVKDEIGNIYVRTVLYNFQLQSNVFYDIRRDYSVGVMYDLNGTEGTVKCEVSYGDNNITVKLLSPIKGMENMTVTGTVNKMNKIFEFSIVGNGMKSNFEILVRVLNSSAMLALTTPINGFEHFEANLDYKGLVIKGNEDRRISILVLNNHICLLTSSLTFYLGLNNKKGLAFELTGHNLNFTTDLYVLTNDYKKSAKMFVRLNSSTLEWNIFVNGTPMLSDISTNMLLIKSTFISRFSVTLNYDLLSNEKNVFIQISDTSGVKYALRGQLFINNSASGVSVTITSSNVGLFRSCVLHAQYNISEKVEISSLLSVDDINYIDIQIYITSLLKAKMYVYVDQVFREASKYSLLAEHDFYRPEKHVICSLVTSSHAFNFSVNFVWPVSLGYTLFTSAFNSTANFKLFEENQMSSTFDLNIGNKKFINVKFTLSGTEFIEMELLLPEDSSAHEFYIKYNFSQNAKTISLRYYKELSNNISAHIHIDDLSGTLTLRRITKTDFSNLILRDQVQINYKFTELFDMRTILELTSIEVLSIGVSLAKNMTGKAFMSISGLSNDSENNDNILCTHFETKLKGNSYYLHWNVSAYDEEYKLWGDFDLRHALTYMNANIKWPSQTYQSVEGHLNYTLTNSKNDSFSVSIYSKNSSFPSILLTKKKSLLTIQYIDQKNNVLVNILKDRKYNILFLSNNMYKNTPVTLKAVMNWDCNFDSIKNANHDSKKSLKYLMKNICTESENHLSINGLTDEPINISYLHTGTHSMLASKAYYLYGEKISWKGNVITDKEKFLETLTELTLTDYEIANVKLLVTHDRDRRCSTVGIRGRNNKYIEYAKCSVTNSGSTELQYNLKVPKLLHIDIIKRFDTIQNTNISKLYLSANHDALTTENIVWTTENGLIGNSSITINGIKYKTGFETTDLSKNEFTIAVFIQGPNNKYDIMCENKDISSEGVYTGVVRVIEFHKGSVARNVSKHYEIATDNFDISKSVLRIWNHVSEHLNKHVFQNVTCISDTYKNILKVQVKNMLMKELSNIQQMYKLCSSK